MPPPPEVRIPLENETLMKVYQPALGESLDSIPEEYKIVFHGFANVGNCESYYLITHHGIHYCDKERVGLLKMRYVPRFFDLDPVDSVQVEARPDLHSAYLRFFGDGKTLLTMWFKDELSAFRSMSAEDEAMRFAKAFGA
jgi:hypothetical protein